MTLGQIIRTAYEKTAQVASFPAKPLHHAIATNSLLNISGGMGIIGYLNTKLVRYVGPKILERLSPATVAKIGMSSFNAPTAIFLSVIQPLAYSFASAIVPGQNDASKFLRYSISILIPAIIASALGVTVTPGALFLLHGGNFLFCYLASNIPDPAQG